MFIVKTHQAVTRTYNLQKINISLWPKEAKEIARQILSDPSKLNEFRKQPKGQKTDWLIAQIEAVNNSQLTEL